MYNESQLYVIQGFFFTCTHYLLFILFFGCAGSSLLHAGFL